MILQETQQEFNTYLKKLINDTTLVESIMSGYNIIHEGVIGKAATTSGLICFIAVAAASFPLKRSLILIFNPPII